MLETIGNAKMNNLLVGNGINIQFGGTDYINKNIIRRAIENVKRGRFPKEIYPEEVVDYLQILYETFPDVIGGKYDEYALANNEKQALDNLKTRYKRRGTTSVEDIGFEDFFLVHNLFCYKHKIYNPEKFYFRESLRCLFLDSIYNSSQILDIYKKFPRNLKTYFNFFDFIFTTNYDNNIEIFSGKKIRYLHGAYHIREDVYDPKSLRNKMSDNPISQIDILDEYSHLYSNALMSFSGDEKKFRMNMHGQANSAVSKFANQKADNPELAEQIQRRKTSGNKLVRRLHEIIVLKNENPELFFSDNFPISKFSNIEGNLEILGLSPNNDNHILNFIAMNDKLLEITYYYYDESEATEMKDLLGDKKIYFIDVKQFWSKLVD